MGVDLTSDWVFTDKMNSEIQVFNLNNLKEKTLENNTNILNQNINNEIIKEKITLAKSAYYPPISFNSGASYNESTYDV